MRIFGLIGFPLNHSFSKKYYDEKILNENLSDVEYKNFPLKSIDELPNLIHSHKELLGLNVTAPYKEVVIPYLDEFDFYAKQIDAVNVIKIDRSFGKNKLTGYNTDIYGFQKSLERHLKPEIKSALILGTGGAAKAVSAALKNLNIEYKFVSRHKSDDVNILVYNELTEKCIKDNLLIINATPLGIFPEINQKPDIPYKFITEHHYLFDLIYNPSETKFLSEGIIRNAKILNGLEMLYLQAEKAWEIFTT